MLAVNVPCCRRFALTAGVDPHGVCANSQGTYESGDGMENRLNNWAVLVGRVLIALLFVAGAVQKMVDPAPAMALLADRGLPLLLVWPALAFNALVAVALIVGVAVRSVAFAAAVYCGVTSLFHFIPEDPWQMSIFVKNWAIAGGCLVLAAHGGGRFALR